MENYFELTTDVPMGKVKELLAGHPRDAKMRLAAEIVALYHGEDAAREAREFFINTFSKREQPVDAPEGQIPPEVLENGAVKIADLVAALGLAKSKGAAKDLIKSGAVSLDGEKVADLNRAYPVEELRGRTLKVGKHQFRKLA
jgi:tyrosyl-tRNA synthetase